MFLVFSWLNLWRAYWHICQSAASVCLATVVPKRGLRYAKGMDALRDMKVMILAAGLGKRMRPLSAHRPKPLVQVNGRALVDYARDLLREAGLSRGVINTHYLAEQMRDYMAHIDDLQLEESSEETLLETGGGLAKALPLLGARPFFALNSDTICLSGASGPVLQRMHEAWDDAQMDMLMLLMPRERAIGYDGAGDFVLSDDQKRIRRRHDNEPAPMVFTGVQLLHPRIFADAPKGAFSMNVIYNRHQSTPDGWFERMGFVIHDGDWLHVGDPKAVEIAGEYLQQHHSGA
jgi:MurNAc alpha-1-phosphate uridylyltransferase